MSHDAAPSIERGEGWCVVTTADGLTGAVVGLHGHGRSGCVVGSDASPFGRHSAVPFVDGIGGSPESVLVTAHLLTEASVDPEAIRNAVHVDEVSSRALVIRADGDEYFVQLHRPAPVRVRLGSRDLDGAFRYARVSADGTWFVLPAS